MIKTNKVKDINKWITENRSHSGSSDYYHLTLNENKQGRSAIMDQLKQLYKDAHEDYRMYYRKLMKYSLDPLNPKDVKDPAFGYPELLQMTTLKGYFGEVFSAIVAENFSPFNEKRWRVPVFYFRNHHQAFDVLEKYKRTGEIKKATMGRTGDDCLAFVLNDDDKIIKVLFCEAKCTASHDKGLIDDAYNKISDNIKVPVETVRIISILEDYNSELSKKWVTALRNLYFDENNDCERYDLISYVCGQHPVKAKSWVSKTERSKLYTGGRKLKVVEAHLFDVEDLICEIYEKSAVNHP